MTTKSSEPVRCLSAITNRLTHPTLTHTLQSYHKEGRFTRPDSTFRNFISRDPSAKFPAEAGRYALYLTPACPWVRRTFALGRPRLTQSDDARRPTEPSLCAGSRASSPSLICTKCTT
jgi:hypothetical protein